jgi:DNA-3-methyladenine glycosylase II
MADRKSQKPALGEANPSAEFPKAQRHLARRDPVLKRLIAALGACTLKHDPNRFAVLVRSIIAQQISTKAAASIGLKLQQLLAPTGVMPAAVLAASPEGLRSAGLSAGKVRALLDLAEKVQGGAVPLDEAHQLDDEAVIERLLPVYGIGRWTAEMFLIFSLGRLDVLPLADRGLRVGAQRQYGLADIPSNAQLVELAEPWRPYRSIATWYFWRSFGLVPQSG